jgi:Tol biopolymer transport system component
MVGGRRALVAVLATSFAVLALGQSSSGVEIAGPHAAAAADEPPSKGTTAIVSRSGVGVQVTTAGGSPSMMSGDGRFVVFEATGDRADMANSPGQTNIFVRDLVNATTTQISIHVADNGTVTGPNGSSSQPSISDDGRFVSFITHATDIGADGPRPGATTIVGCNREPNGGGPPQCHRIYATSRSTTETIDAAQRPRLDRSGSYLIWVDSPQGSSGNPTILRYARICLVGCAGGPLEDTNTVVSGLLPRTTYAQPVFNGRYAVYVAYTRLTNTIQIRRTDVVDNTSIRLDIDPDDSTIRLGDPPSGGLVATLDSPSVSADGDQIAFHFARFEPSSPGFAPPITPAALTGEGSWELLAKVDSGTGPQTIATKVISLDNAGNRVDGEDGAISSDGRFVAFVTSITNDDASPVPSTVHDGLDPPGTHRQVVVRDLGRDPDGGTLKGALATPSASCAPPSPCTGSSMGAGPFTGIVIDDIGSKISFDSTINDLVGTDANDSPFNADTFVRIWQPSAQIDAPGRTFDIGSTQQGTSIEANVPITVSGFGPLTFSGSASDIGSIAGGQHPEDFTVVPSNDFRDCAFSNRIYSGDVCYLPVRFTPTGPGARRANLAITAEQLGSAQRAGKVHGAAGPAMTVAPGDTTRTSLTNAGGEATTGSFGSSQSMVSGDGRWDVFVSDANLEPSIDNDEQDEVFVRDLADPQHTIQISVGGSPGTDPTQPTSPTGVPPDGRSDRPSISDDGRFVSFLTRASNIVPADPAASETFVVCDRDPTNEKDGNGVAVLDTSAPACFPVRTSGFVSNGSTPRLSGNGTKITWTDAGCECPTKARVAALSSPGGPLHAPSDYATVPIVGIPGFTTDDVSHSAPVLNRNGRKVVFEAQTPCCDNVREAVIETTLATGTAPARSLRLDVDPASSDPANPDYLGDGDGFFDDPPATSADGNRVAFAFDNNTASVVLVAVVSSGTVRRTVIESRDNDGRTAAGYFPALSGDGHYLAFSTDASNMHDGVDNIGRGTCNPDEDFAPDLVPSVDITCQIVARDLTADLTRGATDPWVPSELVSASVRDICNDTPLPAGRTCGGDFDSTNPSLDGTGSEVGFDSEADDLLIGSPVDSNNTIDAFVHTWRPTPTGAGLDFGDVEVGTHKEKTATLTEPPAADPTDPSHIFGPISPNTAITGPAKADYTATSQTCADTTLNPDPGENACTLTVRFTPSAEGTRSAKIAVNTAQGGYPRHDPLMTRQLTGVGTVTVVSTGALTADPATLDFGSRLPLAPGVTKTVTLSNSATDSLELTDVSVHDTTHPGAGADYTVDASGCSAALLPGESCALTVTFVGHAVGNRGAELVITDDTGNAPATVTLVATVPKPKITANPGVSPPGRATTIIGSGFAPHRKVDIGLQGFGEHAVIKADGHGAFQVGLVIFRNTPEGPQTVTAHTHAVSKSISASGPLLLAVGSVDILQLVTRH